MAKRTLMYDIKLVNELYKSGNSILLKSAKRNLEWNNVEFENYINNLVKTRGQESNIDYFNELCNINWILLNSIFLSLFSNFENLISQLASIVEQNHSIKIVDIKGNGYIDQYRKYLYLIANIKSAKKNDTWDELDIYKLVRNKLTHEDGNLIKNIESKIEDREEFKFLIENKVVLAGSFGIIRIKEMHFLEKFSELTNKLLDELVVDIEKSSQQLS